MFGALTSSNEVGGNCGFQCSTLQHFSFLRQQPRPWIHNKSLIEHIWKMTPRHPFRINCCMALPAIIVHVSVHCPHQITGTSAARDSNH